MLSCQTPQVHLLWSSGERKWGWAGEGPAVQSLPPDFNQFLKNFFN